MTLIGSGSTARLMACACSAPRTTPLAASCTVTVTLSNELRLENQTKTKNNTLTSNAPKYLADPQWRTYSQAAIAAEKRYIKKTTISAITERDEKIKKLEAVMEEKLKALGGSALDRASAGGILATEMTLQAAAIARRSTSRGKRSVDLRSSCRHRMGDCRMLSSAPVLHALVLWAS